MSFVLKVVAAACATVGIMEWLKNFFRTDKTGLYALIMAPLSLGCYYASERLPAWVIGGALTIGVTQLGYQTIVQAVKKIITQIAAKIADKDI